MSVRCRFSGDVNVASRVRDLVAASQGQRPRTYRRRLDSRPRRASFHRATTPDGTGRPDIRYRRRIAGRPPCRPRSRADRPIRGVGSLDDEGDGPAIRRPRRGFVLARHVGDDFVGVQPVRTHQGTVTALLVGPAIDQPRLAGRSGYRARRGQWRLGRARCSCRGRRLGRSGKGSRGWRGRGVGRTRGRR